jgi:hypothetical protein
MTTNFFARYLDLESELKEGEALGTISGSREDDLTDQLERLWWKLTDAERILVEEAAAGESVNDIVVTNFNFVDVLVQDGGNVTPRRVAA